MLMNNNILRGADIGSSSIECSKTRIDTSLGAPNQSKEVLRDEARRGDYTVLFHMEQQLKK